MSEDVGWMTAYNVPMLLMPLVLKSGRVFGVLRGSRVNAGGAKGSVLFDGLRPSIKKPKSPWLAGPSTFPLAQDTFRRLADGRAKQRTGKRNRRTTRA